MPVSFFLMKTKAIKLLFTSPCLAFALLFIPALAVRGEDWTVNGKTYQDVKVVRVEADQVTILDLDGGAVLSLKSLSPSLQKRFAYDPAKAQAAADQRAQDDAASAQLLRQEQEAADAIKRSQQVAYAEQINQHPESIVAQPSSPVSSESPQAVPRPAGLSSDDQEALADQKKAEAIKAEDDANGYYHAVGRVLQVLPDGFIGAVFSRCGTYSQAFVACDSSSMVDDQQWAGLIVPAGPYHYIEALGAEATIPSFKEVQPGTGSAANPAANITQTH